MPTKSSVRIIGGIWRSRRIPISDNPQLRPSPDRVRETLFNWLNPIIEGANCLDLFAGSGVLGFEALSRGAASISFVEKNFDTLKTLKETAAQFDTQCAQFYLSDALKWLSRPATEQFNIVFLDPPFHHDLVNTTLALLTQHQWLAQDAYIYVEMEKRAELSQPHWEWLREQKTQQIRYGLLTFK